MENQIDIELVLAEYSKRETARTSLQHFMEFVDPSFICEPVHTLLCQIGTDITFGRIKQDIVIVNMPPQSGKSNIVSVGLPPFYFGNRPNDPIILTTYAAELAESKSKQQQTIMASSAYRLLFPDVAMAENNQSVSEWGLENPNQRDSFTHLAKPYKGYMLTGGVKGGVTGFGCMLFIIDDPYKNWEEAQSETVRRKAEEFYSAVALSRIWKGGKLLVPMTRWHPADFTHFLAQKENVLVIRIPALGESQKDRDTRNLEIGLAKGLPDPLGREEGETLAPIRMPLEHLAKIKTNSGSMVFTGLYQQSPISAEGNQIKREWFDYVNVCPKHEDCAFVRYWDKAGTDSAGKFTAGTLQIYDRRTDDFYIEDVYQFQYSAGRREKAIKEISDRDRELYDGRVEQVIEQEPASGGKESAENTVFNLSDTSVHIDLKRASKLVRFTPFAAKVEAKRYHIKRAPWNDLLVDQLCSVPNSEFWDLTDTCTGGYAWLISKFKKRAYSSKPKVVSSFQPNSYLSSLYRSLDVTRRL